MNKAIDTHNKTDRREFKLSDRLSEFIDDLSLDSVVETLDLGVDLDAHSSHNSHEVHANRSRVPMLRDSLTLIDRVNDLSNALSQNLISTTDFTELMDQVRKDKEKLEDDNAQARIKHRISDFEGMLNVFTEGSQAFLSTKVAISQLNSLLD